MITKLLRGGEVAKILDVSKAYAYRLMATGQIPIIKLGRSVRVRQEDLEAFINNNVSNSLGAFPFSYCNPSKVSSHENTK
jgi:excisionase family DNA binding protein